LAKAKVTEANRKQMPKKYKVAQADLPSPGTTTYTGKGWKRRDDESRRGGGAVAIDLTANRL